MALTGKTIGQLALLSGITDNTLFAVEFSGISYNIPYSGFSPSTNYSSATYSELYNLTTGGTLTPGIFYLMTDYQACYDQPNYDNIKNPITTGNYKTGTTEPILLLAISTTGFSPTVYSTLYPQDKITYDITWNTTEITSSPAKGRITERIDNFNNRTDYDNRNILFKRYNGYSYEEDSPLSGLVGISGLTGTTAVLYGNTGTTFTSNFSTGDIVSVRNLDPSFFEVISVVSNSLAIISGVTISVTTDSIYYYGNDDGIMSYYQPNVRQDQVFEYTTFDYVNLYGGGAVNNYIGNYSNLHLEFGTGDFLLANNVFINDDGYQYRNNTIGNGSYNNTFNDDCDNNQIGDGFYNNSTNDDFDGNIIGENFNNNYITANFNNNRIGSDFYSNTLLGGTFYRNNIGNDFNNNVWTDYDFQNNEIGNQFNNNKIYDYFYNNDIGNDFENNDILGQFTDNNILNNFYSNNISDGFQYNQIGSLFNNNTIGENFGFGYTFPQGNKIGNNFYNNIVGEYFYNNTIPDNFRSNQIGDSFQWNIVNAEVDGICLSTGMLYDITTVNVFKNKNGDDRLSYYDELDVLTIETLTEAPCLGGLNALDIPENDLNFGLIINLDSFTITSSDFTFGGNIYQDTTPLGVDGVDGFENTASQNSLYDGYYGTGLSGTSLSGLTTAYNNLGLSLNDSTGRLWYVTWGAGSTIPSGIVKFGSNVDGVSFEIQTIDTSDTNYLTPNTGDGTSLVGTFLFPATFTIYEPLTDKNGWC